MTILKVKPTPVPEDLVPALTDKTFDVLKQGNDLLVVDFFQPCKHCLKYRVTSQYRQLLVTSH